MKVHWSLSRVKGIFLSLHLVLVIAVIIITYYNLLLTNLVAVISGKLHRFKQDSVFWTFLTLSAQRHSRKYDTLIINIINKSLYLFTSHYKQLLNVNILLMNDKWGGKLQPNQP